jgi:hypothetical protein
MLKILAASSAREELIATFDQMQALLRCSAGDRAARAVLKLAE